MKLPLLRRCASDPAPEVRAALPLAIGRLRIPANESVPILTRMFDGPVPQVRANAAIALASYGDAASAALPFLRARQQDCDLNVAVTAKAAALLISRNSG